MLRSLLLCLLLAGIPGVVPSALPDPVPPTDRPNIIVVMADDLPWVGRELFERLPTLRSVFLEGGLVFTDYYGNDPLCCPGRANFLTGLTTDHHGVWHNDGSLLDDRVTIATELDAQGYFTFATGKYFNRWSAKADGVPDGWDRTSLTPNGYYDYPEWLNGDRVGHGSDRRDYQPDLAFRRARRFLQEAPPDAPVFGFINPFAAHGGADEDGEGSVRPVVAPRFQGDAHCADLGRFHTPGHVTPGPDRPAFQQGWDSYLDGWPLGDTCESLLAVDAGVRRIRQQLADQGRLADTLFVFTADNGMGWGLHGNAQKSLPFTTQLPLLVSWPDRSQAPREIPVPVMNLDLTETLCAAAGCQLGPYADGRERSDGVSFLDLLGGGEVPERQVIYEQNLSRDHGYPTWRAVRTTRAYAHGPWHYVRYDTGETELYDLAGGPCWTWQPGAAGDPCELENRAGESLEVEAALAEELRLAMDPAAVDP